MPKYYITSGNLKRIVSDINPIEACIRVMSELPDGIELEDDFYISQVGFRGKGEDDLILLNRDMLDE